MDYDLISLYTYEILKNKDILIKNILPVKLINFKYLFYVTIQLHERI